MKVCTIVSMSFLLWVSWAVEAASQDDLAEYFRRAEHYGFSGSVLVARDGQILLYEGYGFADHAKGIPVTKDTAFDVGSVTKQFTAAAILLLESDGKLSTGDSIGDHLDFVPDDKRAVTLDQLLHHTSGFDDYYWDQNKTLTEEVYLKRMLEKPLVGKPGAQFRYSNFGYHLLKAIIERVSGMSYEAYLREKLFLPSGMVHTGFHNPEWGEDQVARYQDWTTRGSIVPVEDPLTRPVYLQPEGSGGILSTTGDLYQWHRSLENHTVLPADTTSRMYTPALNNYGYGWRISKTARGTTLIEHGGYDSWLGTLAGFYRYVDEDLVILVLANSTLNGTLRHDVLVREIESMVFGTPFVMPPEPQAVNPATLATYAGGYRIAPEASIDISIRNGQLTASTESPSAVRTLMFPNSGKPIEKRKEDTELTSLLNALTKGKLDAVSPELDVRVDADRFARVWTDRLQRWKDERGKLKRIREVHSHGFIFEGEPETHYYVYLEFAKGQETLRAIRSESGWLALNVFDFPKRLELTLAPSGEREFHSWNFWLGTGSKLVFAPEGRSELHIDGSDSRTVAKK